MLHKRLSDTFSSSLKSHCSCCAQFILETALPLCVKITHFDFNADCRIFITILPCFAESACILVQSHRNVHDDNDGKLQAFKHISCLPHKMHIVEPIKLFSSSSGSSLGEHNTLFHPDHFIQSARQHFLISLSVSLKPNRKSHTGTLSEYRKIIMILFIINNLVIHMYVALHETIQRD